MPNYILVEFKLGKANALTRLLYVISQNSDKGQLLSSHSAINHDSLKQMKTHVVQNFMGFSDYTDEPT